ncbi:uncharacterized protein ARMOST_12834 [Armillaria ostoyae]|uniref:Uncharacterized protein n=1 Tax=Armillaria ostoyae TaxID=47428 RepID=A0A284RL25_ARMOS|nr:uncharacterized protein ARMOST_12834 [Armillaria ostoyae]
MSSVMHGLHDVIKSEGVRVTSS